MNISEIIDFMNFHINKKTGAFYTPDECVSVLDRGQMSLYADLQPKYATSQRIKDALAPFRAVYDFNTSNTVSGVIVIPSNSDFLNLLDIQIQYNISNRVIYQSVKLENEDVISNRLNSQISPVTVTSPIGEVIAPRYYRLYPLSGYTGKVTYFRRPAKPVFGYTVISGRVIVYNPATSTQLEWSESWQNSVVIKALATIGINISEMDIEQYSQTKSTSNYLNVNNQ